MKQVVGSKSLCLIWCFLRISLLLFVCYVSPTALQAQATDSAATHTDAYIVSYKHLLSLKSSINDDIERFEVVAPGTRFDLRPNTSLANSYTLSYEFIVFTLSFNPSFININSDSDLRGSTKFIKYATNLNIGRHINQFLSFEKIRGYYLNNTSDFDPGWQSGEPYIQFSKLNYLSWHGVTTYQFDPGYSLFAAVAPNQRQARSAGSLLISLSYNYYLIDDRTQLTGSNSSQRSQHLEVLPSAGYGYTHIIRRYFYSSLKLEAGIGKTHSKLITRLPQGTIQNTNWSTITEGIGTAALGFDNGRFFTGGQIRMMRSKRTQEAEGAMVFGNQTTFEIFLGYRFAPPGLVKRSVGKIKDHF